MNNIRITIFLFLVFCLNAKSQVTFEKIYQHGNKQRGAVGIEMPDGYMIATQIDNCGACSGYVQLIHIDFYGDTISTHDLINFGSEQYPTALLFEPPNNLLILTNNNNLNTDQITLISSDTFGNVNWHYTQSDANLSFYSTSLLKSDSNYLIVGYRDNPLVANSSATFLISLDTSGVFNWFNVYDTTSVNTPSGICKESMNYLISRTTYDTTLHRLVPSVIQIDQLGSLIQTKYYPLSTDAGLMGITHKNAGQFVFGYLIDSLHNTNGLIIKLNNNLDTVWTRTIDLNQNISVLGGVDYNDESITIVSNSYNPGNTNGDLYVYDFDSTGIQKYLNIINGFDNELGASMIATSDNGLLIVSTTWNNSMYPYPSVYKTDSIGSIINYSPSIPASGDFSIFPNPASGVISIKLNAAITRASLKIYNLSGEILLDEIIFTNESKFKLALSNGVYILEVCTDKMNWKEKLIIN